MVLVGILDQHCCHCRSCVPIPVCCYWKWSLGENCELHRWPTRMYWPCLVHRRSRCKIQRDWSDLLWGLRHCWRKRTLCLEFRLLDQHVLCGHHVVLNRMLCLWLLHRNPCLCELFRQHSTIGSTTKATEIDARSSERALKDTRDMAMRFVTRLSLMKDI